METKLLTIGLLLPFIFNSCSQGPNPKEILKKSFEKCQSIENGYYEMEHYMKPLSDKDTSLKVYKCYFKKLENDSIFSSAFHYQIFYENEYLSDILYTGNEFVNYSKNDSTGTIMSKKLQGKEIKSRSRQYTFYSPLVNKESYPLPKDSAFLEERNTFEYMGEETINGIPCYQIRMSTIPENDSTAMLKALQIETNYWISKQDYLPIQYTIAYDLVINNDTMHQFGKHILTKHELNNLKDETQLKLSSIPPYINLKDYEPQKRPKLLPKGAIAPNWSLTSLNGKTVELSDYKGKLVLIDFFYKSCYPCMLALPALQELHEKYKDQGLEVIGIDPYDTKEEDDIDKFLAKRGISYTVLLDGKKDVAKDYRVSGYPTMYLIDKSGKIILSQVGYRKGFETELEEVIKENL